MCGTLHTRRSTIRSTVLSRAWSWVLLFAAWQRLVCIKCTHASTVRYTMSDASRLVVCCSDGRVLQWQVNTDAAGCPSVRRAHHHQDPCVHSPLRAPCHTGPDPRARWCSAQAVVNRRCRRLHWGRRRRGCSRSPRHAARCHKRPGALHPGPADHAGCFVSIVNAATIDRCRWQAGRRTMVAWPPWHCFHRGRWLHRPASMAPSCFGPCRCCQHSGAHTACCVCIDDH